MEDYLTTNQEVGGSNPSDGAEEKKEETKMKRKRSTKSNDKDGKL